MSIISKIERKSFTVRVLISTIYTILLIGAVTMVYPFWLMITGTTKSGMDLTDNAVIPKYLYDDDTLYWKTLEGLFNESVANAKIAYNRPIVDFKFMEIPAKCNDKFIDVWEQFLNEQKYPFTYFALGHTSVVTSRGATPLNLRKFKGEMYKKYNGDISAMNFAEGTEFVAWPYFFMTETAFIYRRNMPNVKLPFQSAWYDFKCQSPQSGRFYPTAQGFFKRNYILMQYTDDIKVYNKSHGTAYASYDEIELSRTYPAGKMAQERQDWEFFVRNVLNLFWVRVAPSVKPAYHDYLQAKYQTVETLNAVYGTKYKNFNEIPVVKTIPYHGAIVSDWGNFLQGWVDPVTKQLHKIPADLISVSCIEFEFQDYLQKKFGSVDKLNSACATQFKAISDIFPPQWEYHYREIMKEKFQWRAEFTSRNFITVTNYIFSHGNALRNTAIYCVLAVLCALIVNPIAAYALSRFRPPSTYKLLLFLMLTMAFPQMVTQIPVFLMLRELGLLNTFAALILPGLANGYQIFLLKGFFDSLPKELYESAMLDGAGETRIFLQLTMSLSTPILAVIALQAFTTAYSNFMMALLICQDRSMWTIMPWLYQLQMSSSEGIIYASLIVASIPTFLVFMLCQNVIMRGIVVPVEK